MLAKGLPGLFQEMKDTDDFFSFSRPEEGDRNGPRILACHHTALHSCGVVQPGRCCIIDEEIEL